MIHTIAATRRRYRSAVLADSPVAYWRLGEASGTTAADEIGSYNGTYVGTPTLGAVGVIPGNTAATFGGTKYVTAGNPVGLQITGAISMELWVKFNSLSATQILASKYLTTGNQRSIQIATNDLSPFNTFKFYVSADGAALKIITGSTAISTGQWYHIIATFSPSSRMSIYVNGVQDATDTTGIPSSLLNTTADWIIANRSGLPVNSADATIDEVAIYNTALSAARVLAHYQAARPPA